MLQLKIQDYLSENPHILQRVLGLMSGTSLDGLDMALCEFSPHEKGYTYKILKTETVHYSGDWKKELRGAQHLSAENYFALNAKYARFMASEVKQFLKNSPLQPFAIASHGHTVFHQPKNGFSTQLGCGATLAALTGLTTVCDFRSLDVALGGQGAPLVPIGDTLLFKDYQACLNLGGIANISFDAKDGKRVAYDSCVVNLLLNYLSEQVGQDYDKDGDIAKSGKVNQQLLEYWNSLDYYKVEGAKSIGREWFEKNIVTALKESKLKPEDLLATSIEHIAGIISKELNEHDIKKVLVTGGGAYNAFLIENLKAKSNAEVIIPDDTVIQFKEALIFAFLGYLRLNQIVNTLSSVTGASADSIGGAVYLIH